MITKKEFINKKIEEFDKIVYGDDELMTEKEKEKLGKFFEEFIEDLKKVAKNNYEPKTEGTPNS